MGPRITRNTKRRHSKPLNEEPVNRRKKTRREPPSQTPQTISPQTLSPKGSESKEKEGELSLNEKKASFGAAPMELNDEAEGKDPPMEGPMDDGERHRRAVLEASKCCICGNHKLYTVFFGAQSCQSHPVSNREMPPTRCVSDLYFFSRFVSSAFLSGCMFRGFQSRRLHLQTSSSSSQKIRRRNVLCVDGSPHRST